MTDIADLRRVVDSINSVVQKYEASQMTREEAAKWLTAFEKEFKALPGNTIPLQNIEQMLDMADRRRKHNSQASYDTESDDSSSEW
jgi:hypothetical protein